MKRHKWTAKVMRMHKVYTSFCRKFKCATHANGWKLTGHDLMVQIEKWAAKNPDVDIVTVDDMGHSTSFLVLIKHRQGRRLWGTTAVYVPQNSGKPAEFFLYPRNAKTLAKLMTKIGKMPEL